MERYRWVEKISRLTSHLKHSIHPTFSPTLTFKLHVPEKIKEIELITNTYRKDGNCIFCEFSKDRSVLLSLAESSSREVSLRASWLVNAERLAMVRAIAAWRAGREQADIPTTTHTAAAMAGPGPGLSVEFFPEEFSLRNTVLVGRM